MPESAAPRAVGAGSLALVLLLACQAERPGLTGQAPPPAGYVEQEVAGHRLVLPEGFQISIYSAEVPGVRFLALGPDGAVYATLTRLGRVVRLVDRDGDGTADQVSTVLQGLQSPHGLAFRGDTLYVAETYRVIRLDPAATAPVVVVPGLPAGGGHFTRTLLLDSAWLYVSVGSSCNLCQESDPRRAAVVRYRVDGSGETLFATGLRNAVGLARDPATGQLWATNNDRDNLGDDLPPDRVVRLEAGGFYGWPYCYLPGRPNPEYQDFADRCSQVIGPAVSLPAHTAPLGLAFYTGRMFPPDYQGDLFVALHGSWNRSVPIGYQVVRVDFEGGRPAGPPQSFVAGWLAGNGPELLPAPGPSWGRPVDVLVLGDGSLLISDDAGGRIYRVTYRR